MRRIKRGIKVGGRSQSALRTAALIGITLSGPEKYSGSECPCRAEIESLAERAGFEPAVRFWRTHAFQACTFDRSVTSPVELGILRGRAPNRAPRASER